MRSPTSVVCHTCQGAIAMRALAMTNWTRISRMILLVPLALAACATPGQDQQEISATCRTLTALQPMSKSDALAYLKLAIPGTMAVSKPGDQGPEIGVIRDANGNVLQRTTYARDVDEQRLFETMHKWSLLGERTGTHNSGVFAMASYTRLDKPVVTDKEANALYFRDITAIEVGYGGVEGQQPGNYVVVKTANGGFAAAALPDK